MSKTSDYVLGTHDGEISRLGLQHHVWRPHMLDAWMRAGMTKGSRVVDIGSGPGYASLDAAEVVGPDGEVVGVERSSNFLSFARRQLERRDISWVRFLERDLVEDALELSEFDLAWCRWVASFVANPRTLVRRIADSLRSGGRVVFHEYQSYATWRSIPASKPIDKFVAEVMSSWRASGGEPDIAPALIPLLTEGGFKLREVRPLIFAVRPSQFMWKWPAAFGLCNSQRMADLNEVSQEWADAVQREIATLSANPNAVMITPMVMEIIAEKVAESGAGDAIVPGGIASMD
jgi:ubiquinone/menaquinone biosynthesis C-methylase UbiE